MKYISNLGPKDATGRCAQVSGYTHTHTHNSEQVAQDQGEAPQFQVACGPFCPRNRGSHCQSYQSEGVGREQPPGLTEQNCPMF